MINTRKFQKRDFEYIVALLNQSNLPTIDLKISNMQDFYVAIVDGDIVGVGGIDMQDNMAFVRSFAVKSEYQGQGVAHKIYNTIEDEAKRSGISQFYLLSETATQYFEKFGFKIIQRDTAPQWVQQSTQFSGICPQSTALMQKNKGK